MKVVEEPLTPTQIFWGKFAHLTPKQAKYVLSDLIITELFRHRDDALIEADPIKQALEFSLDALYEDQIPTLELLVQSIVDDDEYWS